jgi:hypothetical protein
MRHPLGLSLLMFLLPTALGAAELPANWAFQPVNRTAPPTVKHNEVVRNPIDAFVLAKLEEKGLAFSNAAAKAVLLRRVTFDLTGLPPTLDELEAFLKDESAGAYEKVVDRLLHSPRFGERAALFWLDVVRFAETDGFKADDHRPNAWRYRDYVIKSFNDDKPYDRFVNEQLAGDELYPDDPDAVAATGFLRHYPDEYNAINLEQRRQEILNDITDTTGQTFLGLTLGCAKCHDHKFDPIKQQDYYRIQAFFAGWKPIDIPHLPRSERDAYERQLKEWETKTAAVRRELEQIERPYKQKLTGSRRRRFPEEYAKILDVPEERRTPLEKQIGSMVEKQVYADDKGMLNGMKPAEKERYEALKKQLVEAGPKPAEPPMTMAMTDVGREAPATYMLKQGDWKKREAEIKPGYLSAIENTVVDIRPPANVESTGRRTVLAKWLTKPDHPLTARVMVNRLWQQHFCKGIVATPGEFGNQGERPTHPELLDWLATEFVRRGWKLKHMHRLMVLSTAYRQSSEFNPIAAQVDENNKLLWRMNRRRLDGEALRDAILAVSGNLNGKMGGPSIFPELPAEIKSNGWKVSAVASERNRRSIYVYVKRNLRYPLFVAFDAPDRCETCSLRYVSTTAPQALMLLNEKLVVDRAKVFAERVIKEAGDRPDAIVEKSYRIALGRLPSSEERFAVHAFLQKHNVDGVSTKEAVGELCHALMNLNEFIYVD